MGWLLVSGRSLYLACQVCCMAAWGVPLAVHAVCPLALAEERSCSRQERVVFLWKSPVCACACCWFPPADKIIRVYSKNADPAVIKALKYAFTQWSEKRHK